MNCTIHEFFRNYFHLDGPLQEITDEKFVFSGRTIPIRSGIPRFTPDETYSTGNFSRLRERHSQLQLDSVSGATDRRDAILRQTMWPEDFFRGKTILECGCGAGPDTEILASLGAKVMAVDLAGGDVARRNLTRFDNVCLIQASIMDLPLAKKSFDIVFCHRVIQHTPDPEACLRHIMQFVKPGGHFFVDTYARNWTMLNVKYFLRPLTTRMNQEMLYTFIEKTAPFFYWLTSLILKLPYGQAINYFFMPFRNNRFLPQLRDKPDSFHIEYGIHRYVRCTCPSVRPAAGSGNDAPRGRGTARPAVRDRMLENHHIPANVAIIF